MTFAEFLTKKRVNAARFQTERPDEYAGLETEYDALGPASFDQRKKFFINDWRRRFPWEG